AVLRQANDDGTVPDVRVMTATPIPRTAAMTVYGDLDVSTIDELPPGRTPITTTWVRDEPGEAAMWDELRAELAAGRQAYVVCPLVEESEKLEVASATETWERLSADELADWRVGLLHGRMPSQEKEEVMGAFARHELDALVATTVIEVGVNVPNATVMVIMDADRFGVSQLHQLRGRVGRGSAPGLCLLVTEMPDGTSTMERLRAVESTLDGFELAQLDLELRREGDILGAAQSGSRSGLKMLSLLRDEEVIREARVEAQQVVESDPDLTAHPGLAGLVAGLLDEERAEYLEKA
ncbi:MAG: helicase-related protein, partial [Umezawaea sp.]